MNAVRILTGYFVCLLLTLFFVHDAFAAVNLSSIAESLTPEMIGSFASFAGLEYVIGKSPMKANSTLELIFEIGKLLLGFFVKKKGGRGLHSLLILSVTGSTLFLAASCSSSQKDKVRVSVPVYLPSCYPSEWRDKTKKPKKFTKALELKSSDRL